MAGVITTGAHPKALWPGVDVFFGAEYKEWSPEYNLLFDTVPSQKNYEEIVATHAFGLFVKKTEGTSVSFTSNAQLWTNRGTHDTHGLGCIITMEEIEDNLYKDRAFQRATLLGFSGRQSQETICAQVYNRAFNASYVGGDGIELLATNHPDAVGGTFANEPSAGTDLSEAALEDLCIQIETATDDVGNEIRLMPMRLLTHPNDSYNATRILKSELRSATANNDVNALRLMGRIPEVASNHWFTDTDAWFIRTQGILPRSGMILYTRKGWPKPIMSRDNDFDTDNAKMKAIFRGVPVWGNPRALYGSPGI